MREEDDGAGAVAARLTGRAVVGQRRLTGVVTEVALDGGPVVVKEAGSAGAARAEAAGLGWLADAGAVRVPVVHGLDRQWLVTGCVAQGRPRAGTAVVFGRALAGLHTAGAAAFGAPPLGGETEAYIGLAPMRNVPGSDWPGWYAEHRVLPYLRRAVDLGTVLRGEAAVVEQVCERVADLAGPREVPARLHGDLWNGNVLWGADGQVWLIDPAAHGGHRESDLAMLQLFGCPHLTEVLEGYQDATPLAAGWRQRVGLHQLFPLLVHAVLFGRSYAEQALGTARRLLANRFYRTFDAWFGNKATPVNGFLPPSPESKFEDRPEFRPESLHRTAMIGTPAEVIERLRAYEELGVDEYSFWIDNSMSHEEKRDSLELFIKEVVPAFQ